MKREECSVPTRFPAHAAVAAMLLFVSGAGGAGPVTIVLVGDPEPAFERALSAEASELGLAVVRGERDDVAHAAQARGASATVNALSPGRVELWFPAGDGAGEIRETLAASSDATEPFAARVVEEIRARLVKLALLPDTRSTIAPAPEAPPPAKPSAPEGDARFDRSPRATSGRHPRLWAETGIAGTLASGGVPGSLQALVGVGASPGSFELEAFGLVPLTNSDVSGHEGNAEVSATMAGGRARYVLSGDDDAFRGTLGLGGAALFLAMQGETNAPYVAHGTSLVTAALFADAGVRRRVADWLGLRVSAFVGVTVPRPVVEFAGRDVAAWGATFGTLLATAEFGVPLGGGPP